MIASGSSTVESLSDILARVTEVELLYYYLGISKLPTLVNSPLRPDTKPSFGFTSPDGLKVFYRDFATGESGGLFNLFMELWKLPFKEVLIKVAQDLPNIIGATKSVHSLEYDKIRKSYSHHSDSVLKFKVREWRDFDLEYWETYGISKSWLIFGNIHPISHIFVYKDGTEHIFPADKYAYVYIESKDGIPTFKIYQPFSEICKWRSQHDHSVWDLWAQLPTTGDTLIITSSRKDALCVWENTLIPSCSLQAESYLPKEHVVETLKKRFANVYILYDNDFDKIKNYGRIYGQKIAEAFGLKQIEIPEKWYSKDPSDLVKNHGRLAVKETIFNLIKH